MRLSRRLHDRVDAAEFVEAAKHRDRAVLERQAEQLQRDRDAAHIRRIEHADELHDEWLLKKSEATVA